jgi:hypothetical protein
MKYDKEDEITIYALILSSFIVFGTVAYAIIMGC